MKFLLIGNQNCGKTTLFNQLTGNNQHVGNFPGLTVSKKEGAIIKFKDCNLIDFPGIYSLTCTSNEELVTRDYLMKEEYDCIINIVDINNLERNLYLTLQLIEFQKPMIIALNMMDEFNKHGHTIHLNEFQNKIGLPCIPICARNSKGLNDLLNNAIQISTYKKLPNPINNNSKELQSCIDSISNIIHHKNISFPSTFIANKIIEKDTCIYKQINLSKKEQILVESTIFHLENICGTEREIIIASSRYSFIENLCQSTLHRNKKVNINDKIDQILLNKYFAYPILIIIFLFIFYFTFGPFGNFIIHNFSTMIHKIIIYLSHFLYICDLHPIIYSLFVKGIFPGVSSVISFLPIILLLFFFLSILEDSGYMARIVFIMDNFLYKLGLSGRSFISLFIGFGCSVPAILSTRSLNSKKQRILTILFIPFMSCSAKLPIILLILSIFFHYQLELTILLYITSIIIGLIIISLINQLNNTKTTPFIMEIPTYRTPTLKNIFILMKEKSKEFIIRTFTVIFLSSIFIWFLQTFDIKLNYVIDNNNSIFSTLAHNISFIFEPLGFDDWRIITALLSGLITKEAIISTLAILLQSPTIDFAISLQYLLTPISAYSFLLFTILYSPCIATISVAIQEIGIKKTIFMIILQCVLGWLIAFLYFQIISII